MICQLCKKNPATVHVTEITKFQQGPGTDPHEFRQQHICERCAGMMNLPHEPLMKKSVVDIWKLLQQSAKRSLQQADVVCSGCGMSVKEFRSGGKLGCPQCYEDFRKHLDPLLQRMHNALQHRGRVPGVDETEQGRLQQLNELQERLETAVRDEDYEHAARIRDEIQELGGD